MKRNLIFISILTFLAAGCASSEHKSYDSRFTGTDIDHIAYPVGGLGSSLPVSPSGQYPPPDTELSACRTAGLFWKSGKEPSTFRTGSSQDTPALPSHEPHRNAISRLFSFRNHEDTSDPVRT